MKTMKPFKNNSSSLHAVLDEYHKHMRKALHHQQEAYFYLVEALDMIDDKSAKHPDSASEEAPDWIKERFGELNRRIEGLERAVFIGPRG